MNKESENPTEKRFAEIQKQLKVRYVVKDALHCRRCDKIVYEGFFKRENLDEIENLVKGHNQTFHESKL